MQLDIYNEYEKHGFDSKNHKRTSDGSYNNAGKAGDDVLHRETTGDNHKSITVYSCCITDKEFSD